MNSYLSKIYVGKQNLRSHCSVTVNVSCDKGTADIIIVKIPILNTTENVNCEQNMEQVTQLAQSAF